MHMYHFSFVYKYILNNFQGHNSLEELCIAFPRAFALCEMQTASFRIWTWIAISISYNDDQVAMDACLSVGHLYFH